MPSLPVEVCQAILRHSIYVPGLFDPDAFEGDLMALGFGDPGAGVTEGPYWSAEKTRNILRRVCWAWNVYLLGFEHRLVNMSDVMHGRVDKMFLKKAMRISFDRGDCSCTEVCISPLDTRLGRWHTDHRFAAFCRETILPFGFLPAEIVYIGPNTTNSGDIIEVMPVLSQAKVLISSTFSNSGFAPWLFTQTANVEHIHGHIYKEASLGLAAQNLVTVSFRLNIWHRGEKVILELPSLRHLRIDCGRAVRSSEYFDGVLMPLLEKVGDQLRSLYLASWDHGYQMPIDIWDKCPNLERYHPGMEIAVSPPMSHPLHTLSVIPKLLSHAATLQWPGLRRLIVDGRWEGLSSKGVNDLVLIWTTSLIDRVTVEDLDGIPLADALEDADTAFARKLASIRS